ncbi:MAG: hypothetical protein EBX41_07955, partial [Chitinophagia bacterium]|nr:hypothetical protein [Chitinophagia bacterium]
SQNTKHKISLIRALVHKSPLIILDEPFEGLDTNKKNALIDYIFDNLPQSIVIIATNDKLYTERCNQILTLK